MIREYRFYLRLLHFCLIFKLKFKIRKKQKKIYFILRQNKTGWGISARFKITVHISDLDLMLNLKKFFGEGYRKNCNFQRYLYLPCGIS